MSNFYNKISGYTLGDNKTLLVVDQSGYVEDNDINKVILRSTTGFPHEYSDYNKNIVDGYSYIREIVSQDPLSVNISALTTDISGYDGLVVSDDGYAAYRGVVDTYANTNEVLLGGTFVSFGEQCWIIGGWYNVSSKYSTDIWYSENGKTFNSVSTTPSYFTGRLYPSVIIDELNNLYIIGGYESDGSTPRTDIIKGTITTIDEPGIAWNSSVWFDGLSEYTKAAYDSTNNYIFVSEGFIDIDSVGSGIQTSFGTFAPESHDKYTYFVYEEYFNTLVFSNSNLRHRWDFNTARDTLVHQTQDNGSVYTHQQSSASATWNITHNLNDNNYTFVCFDDNNIPLEPASRTANDTDLNLTFNTSESGTCFVLKNAIARHGASWVVDGYHSANDLWLTTNLTGQRLIPASWSGTDPTTVVFNEHEDGYFWGLDRGNVGVETLGYFDSATFTGSSTTRSAKYHTTDSLWSCRGATSNTYVPASISRTAGNHTFTFNQSETSVYLLEQYTRGLDGYLENQENWGTGFSAASWGQDQNNRNNVVFTTDDYSGYTTNYTDFTFQQGTGNPPDFTSNLYVNLPVVSGINQGKIVRSIDSGADWTAYDNLSLQLITWYGKLGTTDIDTTYKAFFYPRSSDVIWESSYGYTPTYLIDDNSHQYKLLAPTIVSSYANGVITVATDSDQVAISRNDWKDYWLHIKDASDSETEYRTKLTGNSSGGAGANIELYIDTDDLTITPTTSDYVQIIVPREDDLYYYRTINRRTNYNNTIWYDGYLSYADDEKCQIPYTTNYLTNLPQKINTKNNVELFKLMETSPLAYRQYIHNTFDILELTPDELKSLSTDQGLISAGLDDQTLRNSLYRWKSDVDAYGCCLDGLNNMAKIIMGSDTDISLSVSPTPTVVPKTGETLIIDLGSGDYNWTYTSANAVKYSPVQDLYYMPVAVTDIDFDAREVQHMSLIHIKPTYISDPIPIFNHSYDATTNKIRIWSDNRLVEQYEASTSELIVLKKPEAERLYNLILNIKKYLPFWVAINYI